MADTFHFALLGLYALLIAATIYSRGRGPEHHMHFATKPLASLVFIIFGLSTGLPSVVMAGLAFSFLGDVLLMGRSMTFFASGLVAFLVALLAYTKSLMDVAPPEMAQLWLAAIPLVIAIPTLAMILPHLHGPRKVLKMPVIIYALVLSLFLWRGLAALYAGAPHGGYFAVGTGLFMIGDALLALGRFTPGRISKMRHPWDLIPYFGAQWLLVIGFGQA